jgi:phospho-N-acetylmuramoyl-pentapeptide-transferase
MNLRKPGENKMLYYLLYPLKDFISGFNIFRYITFRAVYSAVTAFLITLLFAPRIISYLKKLQLGARIREDAPDRHKIKEGTPSMGGLIILFAIIVPTLLWADILNRYVIVAVVVTLFLGAIGFIDDYLKIIKKKELGLIGRWKFLMQIILGLGLGVFIYFFPLKNGMTPIITVPFFKEIVINLGIFYILFIILIIVGTSNAVNLTDGLDGLAIGIVIFSGIAYAILSYVVGNYKFADYLQIMFINGAGELSIFMTALLGASLGFLWFNSHPAEIIMGDTGSLSLGGAIGVTAILIKQELLLVVVGGVFVLEALSVILQVGYFKITGGKRLFKMAPLHHHFELKGLPENKVIVRFWIISAIFALIALSTLKIR